MRHFLACCAALIVAAVLLGPNVDREAAAKDMNVVVLCDFEGEKITDTWEVRGLTVSSIPVEAGSTRSDGRGVKLIGNGAAGSITRSVEVKDWQQFRALTFYAAVRGSERIELRVLALSGRGPAAMLKRFSLESGPWREVVLPLAAWREELVDQLGSFANVVSIAIQWDRGVGEVSLDDLVLLRGTTGVSSSREPRRSFLKLAFPAGDARAHQSDDFLLASNTVEITTQVAGKMLSRCEETGKVLTSVYGVPALPIRRVPLLIYETRSEYAGYVSRLGKRFQVNLQAGNNGTSALGVLTSYFHLKYGWDRPTYTYLAAGSYVRRYLGLASTSNWITVALASAVQVRLHPDSMPADFVQRQIQGLVDGPRTRFRRLDELFDPEISPTRERPQFLSLMEFLVEEKSDALPDFWKRVRKLEGPVRQEGLPALLAALRTDLPTLEREYLEWGYGWMPDR